MEDFLDHARRAPAGLLGTWVKIPSLEMVQLLGRAGFDLVVIDLEHAPIDRYRAVELIVAAQSQGMAALVRLPDPSAFDLVQPLLDGGADGLLVPRIASVDAADAMTRRMVFAPIGERGLGLTSRAGQWGLRPMQEYVQRGDRQCLRMIQLEDWASLEKASDYAALPHVGGLFVGHGDLFLSSGKPAADPEVRALTERVLTATRDAGVLSGAAASTPEEAREYLAMGFSIVMVSNDATLFARAAAEAASASRS